VDYLDRELKIGDFQDSSNNGLQVENSGELRTICCGVDASLKFFRAAKKRNAGLLICHHGLSWNDSLKRITGLNYKRLGYLMGNDMALYACHLPLDGHPRYGNNVQIAKAVGLTHLRKFAEHGGVSIGVVGTLAKPLSYERFKKRIRRIMDNPLKTMDFGKRTVKTVAVVSGGAGSDVAGAAEMGADVFLSGESSLAAYGDAQDCGINAVFAGHYVTETFGVKALAGVLKRKFKVDTEFVDLGIGF
jgi:dinuclear metal center YbgI/SA1388 family protein